MNSIAKNAILLGASGAALFFGLRMKHDQEVGALKHSSTVAKGELEEAVKNLEILRAKLEVAKTESKAGSGFEEKHNQSVAEIAAEKKQIAEVLAKWSTVDAERVAAVKAVRDKEPTRPPGAMSLADGSQLTQVVIRSVPDEKTVSVEHSGGLGKIPVEKLPEEVKARLGIGWKVEPPPMLDFDGKGDAIVKQGTDGAAVPTEELDLKTLDTSNIAAVVKSLALVESHLTKTSAALETEKAVMRKHSIYKPDLVAPGTDKTYRALKEECQVRLVSLANRVEALKGARGTLQQKLKTS